MRRSLSRLSIPELQNHAKGLGINTKGRRYDLIKLIMIEASKRENAARIAAGLDGLQGVITTLNAINTPFVCVGSIPLDASTPIALLVGSGPTSEMSTTYTSVHFPLRSDAALQPLIDASRQASFGRGREDVLDPNYRRALVLHPDRFGIAPAGSLEPHALGIVDSIRETLFSGAGADSRRIVAVLDKLNIYSEGDFFKGHIDTPTSPDMFGTLLVNLPVAHEGGQLVIRSPAHSAEKDEGSPSREDYATDWGKDTSIEWIAFFSDCEHEVLPVTRGNRVTLAYTLSFASSSGVQDPVDVQQLAGSKDLSRQKVIDALKAPGVFTRDRRRLCFYLQHKYPISSDTLSDASLAAHLKGKDIVLFHALKALGATVTLHLVFFSDAMFDEEGLREEWKYFTAILPTGAVINPDRSDPMDGLAGILRQAGARTPKEMGIVEVTDAPSHFIKLSYTTYGNEYEQKTTYGSACIIATMGDSSI